MRKERKLEEIRKAAPPPMEVESLSHLYTIYKLWKESRESGILDGEAHVSERQIICGLCRDHSVFFKVVKIPCI